MTNPQYIRQILRRIRATDSTKRRIRADLMADLAAREESGQSPQQIQAEMGNPDRVAAEFNASFAGTDAELWYRRQRIAKILAIVLAAAALLIFLSGTGSALLLMALSPSVGIIGGADGPTSVYVTSVIAPGGSGWDAFVALFGLPVLLALLALACLIAWLIFRRHRS